MILMPAYSLSIEALALLFNAAFAGYVGGDVHFTTETMARFLAHDNVDLGLSQVMLRDDQPIGFGMVARQGWISRLAAFGVIPEASGAGVGKAAMTTLIEQARERGDRIYDLEVIEQNPRAVRLYESVGFKKLRRLVGYEAQSPGGEAATDLQPIDIYEAAKVVVQHGAADLPAPIAGTTVARYTPPNAAYRLDHAYAVISDPNAPAVGLRALIVEPDVPPSGAGGAADARDLRAAPRQNVDTPGGLPRRHRRRPFGASGLRAHRTDAVSDAARTVISTVPAILESSARSSPDHRVAVHHPDRGISGNRILRP